MLKISNEDAAFVLGKNGRTSAPPPRAARRAAAIGRTAQRTRADDDASARPSAYPHRTLLSHPLRCSAEEKIARVSGADLDLFEQSLTLEIRGTDDERARAKKYVECVMAQRVGPVTIEENPDDDDLTVIVVPSEAVGFVTGAQGNFLRQVEEEWGTLMFFADFRGRSERMAVRTPRSSSSRSSSRRCSSSAPR